ncbi:hypothetical protein PB1A_0707 [Leuconostoc inhae]|uniref:Uncharacterized protein n=2 Tax=Leuconostoc TaxID=1243 RepID=A0AAN2QUT4_9LACO|nr:hypothetical protein LEGAS_1503 [Leuconostoc gasicomitatum LMG 18811]CUR64178.1 Uncharacterized protein LEKG_1591 [Leuconostoc gasicomitatum KG16-1]CUW07512.1 hypothetical protein PL111_0492 [Leuconostoc inhae]CUW11195.1 hypothetical protein C122C_0896 [Leuconostoc gasicomitatum]CUW11375.1 hypothetical protein C120C_1225 [Leuconostoc inhae]
MIMWLSEVFILLAIIFMAFSVGVAFGQDDEKRKRTFK